MKKKSVVQEIIDDYNRKIIYTTIYTLISSIATVTLITFVILKCLKIISWNWVWVLSPLWISIGGFALIIIFAFIIIFIKAIVEVREKEKKDNNG